MTYPKTGGVELAFPQDNADAVVNASIRRVDALANRAIIADRDLTAPPGACADGANYLVAAAPTGLWAGQAGKLATAVGTNASNGWTFQTVAVEGFQLYVQDENIETKYDGAAWVDGGGTILSTASTTEQLTGTSSAKASTPDSVAALWEQGSDVASAGTVSLGEGGYFNITGTTTITDVDFATDKAGRKAWVKFAGILTLTHNASTLILPTGASITTAAGDTACFVSEGSDAIRCVAYNRASGQPLAAGAVSLTMASTVTQSGTPATNSVGFLGAPQNLALDSGNHTLALVDSGASIDKTSNTARDLTIPANGSVAFPIGTIICGSNEGTGAVTMIITTDTLRWGSSTGTRTIAQHGSWTIRKLTSTVWRLTGDGIT